ncbi:MAG: GerMN domain-containing protein [Fimbriimonadaceae bacterium]|nr:GerMN domain-containing protein [Chthonomonadaceae bacterium]MCO5297484.1 GerMN domain-containing protein [Fimbriimonadaceae bacterium]
MARRKKSKTQDKSVWALLALGLGVVGALAAYVKFTPADRVPEPMRRPAATSSKPAPAATQVWVFSPHAEGVEIGFDRTKMPVPTGVDAKVYAVNEFLSKSKIAPEGARLVSAQVIEGEAQLHFNRAFDTTYGSTDESALIQGLQRTFGQFPDIQALRFYVEDTPMSTTGNIDLSEPVPVLR